MTYPLPKWLQLRYAKLLMSFSYEAFTHTEAKKVLKDTDEKALAVILSELRKKGWLTVAPEKTDSRRKNYKLKSSKKIFFEMESAK